MVRIKGLQKTSLLDYEPHIASIVFLAGCNLRCGYCQNPELARDDKELNEINEDEVIKFLEQRGKWIEGVCISGGEPTIQKDLPAFIQKIKNLGLKVKLDTNGTNPEMLKVLIEKKLIDYIAMDIKTSEKKYSDLTKTKVNTGNIKKSADIIKKSGIKHEFRITAVPGIVNENDIMEMGNDKCGVVNLNICCQRSLHETR